MFNQFRQEIFQHIRLSLCDCIQNLLSSNYSSMTLLFIYGTMWWFNIRFDTRLFAITSCMLGFMRVCVIEFFSRAIRELSHYLPARKRIEVRRTSSNNCFT
jgi:hypothetical protein